MHGAKQHAGAHFGMGARLSYCACCHAQQVLGMHPMPGREIGHLNTLLDSGMHPSPICSWSGVLLESNILGSKQCVWIHFLFQIGSSPTLANDFFRIPYEFLSIFYICISKQSKNIKELILNKKKKFKFYATLVYNTVPSGD